MTLPTLQCMAAHVPKNTCTCTRDVCDSTHPRIICESARLCPTKPKHTDTLGLVCVCVCVGAAMGAAHGSQ